MTMQLVSGILKEEIGQNNRILISETVSSMKLAYMIHTSISFIGYLIALVKDKKLPYSFIWVIMNKGALRSSMFLGTLTLLRKLMMRYLIKNHNSTKQNAFISGFISGFIALVFLPKSQQRLISLIMISRSFEAWLNSAQTNNIVKKRDYYLVIFSIMQTLFGYALFAGRHDILSPTIHNIYQRFSMLTQREWSFIDACQGQLTSS